MQREQLTNDVVRFGAVRPAGGASTRCITRQLSTRLRGRCLARSTGNLAGGHCGGAIAAARGRIPKAGRRSHQNWLRMQSTALWWWCCPWAGPRRGRADLGVVGGHGGAGRRSHRRDGGRRISRRTTGGNRLPLGISPRESTVVVEVHGSLARVGLAALHQLLAELMEAQATFSSG
jgi:hypothetical protein